MFSFLLIRRAQSVLAHSYDKIGKYFFLSRKVDEICEKQLAEDKQLRKTKAQIDWLSNEDVKSVNDRGFTVGDNRCR